MRSGRRGRRRLTLDRRHGRWSGGRGGRRGSVLSRSLPWTGIGRLDGGLLSRRLLLRRRAVWRLLRYAHGRLDWRWVVLLLRSHVGLGAVGKLHALLLVATHIGRVRMVTVRGTPVSRLAGGGGESSWHGMQLCMVWYRKRRPRDGGPGGWEAGRGRRGPSLRQAQHSGPSYSRYQQEADGDTAFRLSAGR